MTPDPAVIRPHRDILDDLWRLSSATTGTIILALLLAATLAVAAGFPQEPAGLEPAAEQHWLASAAGAYGSLGSALRTLGIFNVQESIWLRVLLAALAYHLLLRLADQVHYAWGAFRRGAPIPPPRPGLTATEVALPAGIRGTQPGVDEGGLAADETAVTDNGGDSARADQVVAALRPRFPFVAVDRSGAAPRVYARRHAAGALAPLLGYLGALLVLLGLLVNGLYGWHAAGLTLAPGGQMILPPAPDIKVHLTSIAGAERAAVSAITVSRGNLTRAGALSYAQPFRWGNLWIAQRATGPALAASAQDAGGKAVLLQRQAGGDPAATLSLAFTASETEQTFLAPARNVALRTVSYPSLPERGYNGPVFLVEAYRGDNPSTPIVVQFVSDAAQMTIDGVTYTLRREQHAVLQAAYQPGLALLLAGGLLAFIAAAFTRWWGLVEAWVELGATTADTAAKAVDDSPARVSVAALLNRRAELARVTAALAAALPLTATSPASAAKEEPGHAD